MVTEVKKKKRKTSSDGAAPWTGCLSFTPTRESYSPTMHAMTTHKMHEIALFLLVINIHKHATPQRRCHS